MSANIFSLFRSRFPVDTGAACMVAADGAVIYTYARLEEESARIAGLLTRRGLGRGDRAVVQVDKSAEAVVLYLACLRKGVIFIPLNTAYTSEEIRYFLGNSMPGLLVCKPKDQVILLPVAEANGVDQVLTLGVSGEGSLMDALGDCAPDTVVAEMAEDEVAAILYTSGTTGLSKGAMLTHGNLSSNALALQQIWGWTSDDVLLHALPIFHAHGLFVGLHLALLDGTAMVFLPKFDLGEVVASIPMATVFMGVPTFYTRLLESKEFTAATCRNMRLFISGSAPLLEETFNGFETRTGFRILERYGMTEAAMITSNPLQGDRLAGTVGYPLPDVRVRVVGDSEEPMPVGEVGQLQITGPNVFKAYWRMPEKTREEFTLDGYFRTGDLARLSKDGRVSIVGRSKDLIISGGYNVYPKEIERQIDRIDGIRESAVIGVAHPDFGEAVIAVVVPEVSGGVSEQLIISSLQDRMARFKQPKKVFFVEALPRNAMGKVQKKLLRDQFGGCFENL